MIILRSAVLLMAALTLANCCMTGSCSGPVATTAAPGVAAPGMAATSPVAAPDPAWDGLGAPTAAELEGDAPAAPAPKRTARRRAQDTLEGTDISAQSGGTSRGKMSWDEEQAVSRADEARLKQKLIICKNCSSSQ